MKPVSVLLVDDDEDDYILTRDIFADIPKSENYKLSWVNNYEEAINAMLKSHYDIYLVDYRLGKYTGLDLLHEAIKSNVDEPIIILTGKGDAKVDEDALETGAADYLVKDQISPYAIERSIRYALKHKRALKALRESENKFRIIFERSKEPFLIMDSLGGIRDVNHAGLKLLGYGKEELLELNGTQLFYNRKQAIDFSDALDRNGAINDFQTELISRDHEIKKVSISAFLQIDQHARLQQILRRHRQRPARGVAAPEQGRDAVRERPDMQAHHQRGRSLAGRQRGGEPLRSRAQHREGLLASLA